jgi:hypothetical protein
VDRLSDAFEELGEQQHNKAVLEFPPCKKRAADQILATN